MSDTSDIPLPCKLLTIWQPWATLIAIGVKTIETRGWITGYRGPLLIHAAKKWNGDLKQVAASVPRELTRLGFDRAKMTIAQRRIYGLKSEETLGHILCLVDLVDCVHMPAPPNPLEGQFGHYGPGRFGWKLENIRAMDELIPYKGAQGLVTVKSMSNTLE